MLDENILDFLIFLCTDELLLEKFIQQDIFNNLMVLFYYTLENPNINNLYTRILHIFSNACEVRIDDEGDKICKTSKMVILILFNKRFRN